MNKIYNFIEKGEETLTLYEEQVYKNMILGNYIIYDNEYSNALKYAQQYIEKVDKKGLPIYVHGFRIASALELVGYSREYVITAILHDILEDSWDDNAKNIDRIRMSFGEDIIDSIIILTKQKKETYFDYIKRIIKSNNDVSIKVKQMDISDHLFYSKDIPKSLIKRYKKASEILGMKFFKDIYIQGEENG